jgi:uncharacterized membrane protein
MADIKFGTNQLSNPTPANINKWVRVITIAIGVFMAWMATANLVGPNTKDILNQVLGLFLGLINSLAPLFGVELSSNQVPAKDVAAIDTHGKI